MKLKSFVMGNIVVVETEKSFVETQNPPITTASPLTVGTESLIEAKKTELVQSRRSIASFGSTINMHRVCKVRA